MVDAEIMSVEMKRQRRAAAIALAGAWILSLFIPAAGWGIEAPGPGYQILMLGWLGVLSLQFGWFANPIFLASLSVAQSSVKPGLGVSGLLSFLLVAFTINPMFWTKAITPDGGYTVVHGPGYYVWIVVMILTAIWLMAISVINDL